MNRNVQPVGIRNVAAVALALLTLFFAFAAAPAPVQAQTPTILYTFQDTPADACEPVNNIVQGRDGNMYGIGLFCGSNNNTGAVFKISPTGTEKVIFSFPNGWSFCFSGLTLGSDGNFYGTCFSTPGGNGSIFKLTPAGVFTDLHDFSGSFGDTEPIYAPIQASDGNFYGTTGYYPFSCGNIYKLTPAGVYTNLKTLSGTDCGPASSLIQASDGNLYGTLYACSNTGTIGCVYKISTAGVFSEIFDFSTSSQYDPCTGVIQGKDGKLYGATNEGGANTFGGIYKVSTTGAFTDLHDFVQTTDASCVVNAGRTNVNLLQVNDGSIYGVNGSYGPNGNGSIWKLTPAGVFTVFLFPNPAVDGDAPLSSLIQHTNGQAYGTTPFGGPTTTGAPLGTFYRVSTGDAAFVNLEPTQRAGVIGAKVGIFGQGFTSASVVKFGGVTATTVTHSGATYLTATFPTGAHTGVVTVTTGSTTLTTPQSYKVKPKITSFTPASGPVGTLVTINGTGLTQTSAVKFGTVAATTFTVVSDSKVTAVVPSGLPTGPVTISITTPGGAGNSPTKFAVQ